MGALQKGAFSFADTPLVRMPVGAQSTAVCGLCYFLASGVASSALRAPLWRLKRAATAAHMLDSARRVVCSLPLTSAFFQKPVVVALQAWSGVPVQPMQAQSPAERAIIPTQGTQGCALYRIGHQHGRSASLVLH